MKFDLNNLAKVQVDINTNAQLKPNSPVVEIFSALAAGESSRYSTEQINKTWKYVKELAQKASEGDIRSRMELNTIVKFAIEPKLLDQIKLFDFIGTFRTIGYHEQPMMKTYKHESVSSNWQATHGDVPFAVTSWREYPIATKTISSGYAVDYREIASGNLDKVQEGMGQVKTDMINKTMSLTVDTMVNAIANAPGVKYYNAQGITNTALDTVIKNVRRFGKPSILGDYNVLSALYDFAGFTTAEGVKTFSEAVMEEIRKTGMLSMYKGSPVVEIPNAYNMTEVEDGNFKTYLREDLLFVVPKGHVSAVQAFQRGGLTSMSAVDIVTGTDVTRFDIEFGVGVAEGMEYTIGLLVDAE